MTPDSAAHGLRIVDPQTGLREIHREDIVVRKGQLTLLNESLSPDQATTADLLAIADALGRHGVELLLIRSEALVPTIVVDWARRKDAMAALVAAFADEPFYAKAGSHAAVLVAEGKLPVTRKSRVLRLFRPRVDQTGRLRYGLRHSVRLEFWDFGAEEIVAPAPNAIMRPRLPRHEAIETTVNLYGREWTTLAGMFDTLASDITFDIDIVYSWVDGSSLEFQRQRARRMKSYVVGSGDDSAARYRQLDELKYALRSVNLFAPWIRRIFIVTDSPVPAWLRETERVTIVRSEEIFENADDLPTHNSHAIESQLHHIDGLSEHFLYSNDDMFFARPTGPNMFFSPGGVTRFIESHTRIGLGENQPERSGFENAARVNRALLLARFGRVTTNHLEHAPTPLRRSVLYEMEAEFADDFARTAASPFRSSTDISVTNSLYHYYSLMTGRAVAQPNARVKYVETTLLSSLGQMKELLRNRSQDFFCLNDGSQPEISVEERLNAVLEFLNAYFPIPGPWEIAVEDQDGVRRESEEASS